MNLRARIKKEIEEALKRGEKEKVAILRFLWSKIQNEEIAQGKKELTDEQIFVAVKREIKKLKEALSLFKKGKREDLVKKTEFEIKILEKYLPKQLTDKELEKEIEKIISQNPSISKLGPLVGLCIRSLKGRADGQRVAEIVRSKLQSSQTLFSLIV